MTPTKEKREEQQLTMLRVIGTAAPPRFFRSFASSTGVDPASVRRIVLPQLSPTFEHGTLSQWVIAAGEHASAYDVVYRVSTTTLTEPQSRADYLQEGEDPTVELQIETIDDGYVGRHLVEPGSVVKPGDLLALLVEDEDDVAAVNATHPEEFADCEEFTWQAYTMR